MSTFPFLRFLPGKYGDEFRKGKKANAKIAQKYFYDMKVYDLSLCYINMIAYPIKIMAFIYTFN